MTRKRHSRSFAPPALASILIIVLSFLAVDYVAFSMVKVGDAFGEWVAVEIDGKMYYMPSASKGPSWDFWADADLYPSVGRVERYYSEPGKDPACGGVADLVIRSVSSGGLYFVEGMLVQTIAVSGAWLDTTWSESFEGLSLSRPCGENITDAWIYVTLDQKQMRGGTPIYVKVSDKSLEKWIKEAEQQVSVINKLKDEMSYAADVTQSKKIQQLIDLGHPQEGQIEETVPFTWFPENSTLRLKVTGFYKSIINPWYRTITYLIYISPPEGKIFNVKTEVSYSEIMTHYGVISGPCIDSSDMKEGWFVVRHDRKSGVCVVAKGKYTVYNLVLANAENTPKTVATTVKAVKFSGNVVTTTSIPTVMYVNEILESTTATLAKPDPYTMQTTVTITLPATTYTVSNAEQAEQIAERYEPPKPLIQTLYEKMVELFEWLKELFTNLFRR